MNDVFNPRLDIVFFSPHDLPSAHISRNFDYAKRLVKKGHRVTVIANNFSHRDKVRIIDGVGRYFAISHVEGVKVAWLNTTGYKSSGLFRAINAISYLALAVFYAVKNIGRIDISIGDSVPPTAGLAAYVVSVIKQSKFVFQVRDVWPIALVYDKAITKWGFIYTTLRALEIFLYKKAYKIYATVPMLEGHIADSGADVKKLVYVPNGVDLAVIPYVPRGGGEPRTFRILYAGGFGNAHDVESIVRSAKILSLAQISVRFDFYGDGLKLKSCTELARELSLTNVFFHSSIDKSSLSTELLNSDLLIASVTNSDAYKFGINLNKIYDYLAAGRPIVLAVKSTHRPIEDANCGYIAKPECPEEMSSRIRDIYNMTSQERDAMGYRGRKYAEEHYDLDSLAFKFESNLF
jgi:glycosyltransferase involved in cell wall biosynthesis